LSNAIGARATPRTIAEIAVSTTTAQKRDPGPAISAGRAALPSNAWRSALPSMPRSPRSEELADVAGGLPGADVEAALAGNLEDRAGRIRLPGVAHLRLELTAD